MGRAMRFLLDTHALLWWWTDDPRLPESARSLIRDETNTILVSAVSAWEIATKHRLGKLAIGAEAMARFAELTEADGFEHLPVTHLHALHAGGLANEHRDPFDRMLAAQSRLEAAPAITGDEALAALGAATRW